MQQGHMKDRTRKDSVADFDVNWNYYFYLKLGYAINFLYCNIQPTALDKLPTVTVITVMVRVTCMYKRLQDKLLQLQVSLCFEWSMKQY